MGHNILLVCPAHIATPLRVLKRDGHRFRRVASARLARQELRTRLPDLLFIDLPSGATSLRLAGRAAQTGVPAVIVAVDDPTVSADWPTTFPRVLHVLSRSAEPLVVHRVIRYALLQLQQCQSLLRLEQAVEPWPLALLSARGEVLSATPAGLEALGAVCAPDARRPVGRVGRRVLSRIQSALGSRRRAGEVDLFRRDEVLSHYACHVQKATDGNLAVLLLDARHLRPVCPGAALASLLRQPTERK